MRIPPEDELCVYCGTDKSELSRLRAIEKRCEDAEKIAKAIYHGESGHKTSWEERDEGPVKQHSRKIAHAVRNYLMGRK